MCITNAWSLPSFYNWKRADLWNRPFPMSLFAPCSLNCMNIRYLKQDPSVKLRTCIAKIWHSEERLYYIIIFYLIIFYFIFLQKSFQCHPVCSIHQGVIYLYHLFGAWFIMWFILVVLHGGFLNIHLVPTFIR